MSICRIAVVVKGQKNLAVVLYPDLTIIPKVASIGVGAKDITAIDWISDHVRLDWAMFACSVTPYSHGGDAKRLLKKLGKQ